MNIIILPFLICMLSVPVHLSAAELIIEPTAGNTIAFNRPLSSSELLTLSSAGLQKGEVFRFQKCGPGCDTATSYKVYPETDFKGKWQDAFFLEDGEFYFWLENTEGKTSNYGEVVKPNSLSNKNGTYTLNFESGSVFEIRLNKSIQPTANAADDCGVYKKHLQ